MPKNSKYLFMKMRPKLSKPAGGVEGGAVGSPAGPNSPPKLIQLREEAATYNPTQKLHDIHRELHFPEPSWQSQPWARMTFFIIGVLAVFAIAAVLFPSATITLAPEITSQTVTFTAFTNETVAFINPSGAVPTQSITVIVEGHNSVPATGNLVTANTKAAGVVVFTNQTNEAIQIPAGTIVISPEESVKFVTLEDGSIAGAAGATLTIPIEAVEPGTNGNLWARSITAIEGPLGLSLTVDNAERTRGGSNQTLTAPTSSDRMLAYDELLAVLYLNAEQELASQLDTGDVLLSTTPTLLNVLQETYLPAEEIPSDVVQVNLRLEFEAHIITQADLAALGQSVLDANLSTGYTPLDEKISLKMLGVPILAPDGSAAWEMTVERNIRSSPDASAALPHILGTQPQAASEFLYTTLDLASPPQITQSPEWWPWLPFLPFQIDIQ